MGTGTLSARTNGQTIDETWFNVIRTAIYTDFVPRNSSGIVTASGGSLGDAVTEWLYAYVTKLKLVNNGNTLTISPPSTLATTYEMTLPEVPSATIGSYILGLDNTGAVSASFMSGFVFPFAGTSTPSGFLYCDGSSVSRTTYASLFAAIGTAHGSVDANTFNLPDYRGRFLRGIDGGTGRDPDAASRTAMNSGGNTGSNVGTVQGDQYESHIHTASGSVTTFNATVLVQEVLSSSNEVADNLTGSVGVSVTVDASGGNETRPINANVRWMIKI
jgi:microcystin-dependent protein